MRTAVDLEKVHAFFKENDEIGKVLEEGFQAVLEASGIDLEKDVIPYLDSPISLTVVGGQFEQTAGYGGALWLPLKHHPARQLN